MRLPRKGSILLYVLLVVIVIVGVLLVYFVMTRSTSSPAAITPPLSEIGAGQTASITVSWTGNGGGVPYSAYLYQSTTSTSCDTATAPVGSHTLLSTPGFTFTVDPAVTTYYCGTISGVKSTSAVSATVTVMVKPTLTTPTLVLSPAGIDPGQSSTIVAAVNWAGGVSPYSVTLYSGSNSSCTYDTAKAALQSGSNPVSGLVGTSQVFNVKDPPTTVYYCAVVTDSASVPHTKSSAAAPFSINAALSAVVNPGYLLVDSGSDVTMTAVPSGGLSPYSYQWYTGTDCSSGAPIAGKTSSTLNTGPLTSTPAYAVLVKDSSVGLPSVSTCVSVPGTVNPEFTGSTVAISPPGAILDAGQTTSLTVSWGSAGTGPYTVQVFTSSASDCSGKVAIGRPASTFGTSATFTVSPTSTGYYCASVEDSAIVPETASTSAPILVTVNPAITPAVTLSISAIDTGQTATVTATVTWSGGTSPYSVTFLSGTSSTCAGDITKVTLVSGPNPNSGLTKTSASFTFTAPSGTTQYCASVADAAATPATGLSAAVPFTVSSALTASISPSPPIIDMGSSITLSAHASGGVQPFSYQWYNGASCASGTAMSGQTASTYSTGTIPSTASYSVEMTDGSTGAPAVHSCASATVTVNPTLDPVFSLSVLGIDAGQTATVKATVSWTGGTSPYTVTLYSGTSTTCTADTTRVPVVSSTTTNPTTSFTGTSVTFAFTSPTLATEYCASVQDSASVPMTVYSSALLFTVNPAMTTPSLALSLSSIDTGQTATVTAIATWSGGTSPYTVTLFSGVSSTCSADTTVVGVLSGSNPGVGLTGSPTTLLFTAPGSTTYYCATVTDGSAAPVSSSSSSAQFTVNPVLTATISPASQAVDDGQSVAVTMTALASGGTSPYQYQWYVGSGCSSSAISGQTSSSYSPIGILLTTTYSVRVTDSSAGSPAASYCAIASVTVNPALSTPVLVLSPSGMDTGQSVAITASVSWSGGTNLYTIKLFSGTSSTCSLDTTSVGTKTGVFGTSASFSTSSLGSSTYYCATVTDSAAIPVTVSSVVLFAVNPLGATISPASPAVESGQSTTLTAVPSQGIPPYFYQWYTGGSCSTAITGATSSSYATGPLTSTTSYSVKVTDSSIGSPAVSSCAHVTVSVNSALTVTISPASPAFDSGQSTTLTAMPSQGIPPYTYQWYTGSSCASASIMTGSISSSYATGVLTATATYSVKVTDSSPGSPPTSFCASDTVTVHAPLTGATVTISPASTTLDSGSSATLTVSWSSAGTPPYSVQLTTSASASCTGTSPTGLPQTGIAGTTATFTAAPLAKTYYCATVTDGAPTTESASTTSAAVVTVDSALGTPTLVLSLPAIDYGQNATITATVTWSGGTSPYAVELDSGISASCASDTGVVVVSGPNPKSGLTGTSYSFTFVASPASTTYYCAKVTDGASPRVSETSSSAVLIVNPALSSRTSPSSSTVDNGQSVTLTVAASGGTAPYSYQWYSGSVCTDTVPGAKSASYAAGPLASNATFSVLVTDSSPGIPGASYCASASVTVELTLTATITPASPAMDSGQYLTLTAVPAGGTPYYFYQWYSGASCASGNTLSGQASPHLFTGPLTADTSYSVKVTDSSIGTPAGSGCASTTLTVNPVLTAPVINASSTSVESGGNVTLGTVTSFSGGTPTYTCQWLVKAPGALDFTNLDGLYACSPAPPNLPTWATGPLSTAGTWEFEYEVTDNSGVAAVTVFSNIVSIIVH